jgi:hypothetical protein
VGFPAFRSKELKMHSIFRNAALAAGIALLVFAAGCSSKSPSNTDPLTQQQKDVLGSQPPPGAAAAAAAKMRDQGIAYQQQAQQRQQQYMAQQQAQQNGKR